MGLWRAPRTRRRATYKEAEKKGVGRKRKDGCPKRGGGEAQGDRQTLNGFNRSTGLRKRCYRCDCEYHLAPKCPWQDTPRGDRGTPSQERSNQSQWQPRFQPRQRNIWTVRRPRVKANGPFRPPWMWGGLVLVLGLGGGNCGGVGPGSRG